MADAEKKLKILSEEEADFVMSFVEHSDKARDPYVQIWEETLRNYMVRPAREINARSQVRYPYLESADISSSSTSGRSQLKDPESHQIVESLVADEMILLFSDIDYVRALPTGIEDAVSARTVTALMRYVFSLPGHYRTLMEWMKDGRIFGTGIIEGGWDYIEQEDFERIVEVVGGIELAREIIVRRASYDDYKFRPVDLMDFFWDPSATMISDMLGVAKRFHTTAREARQKAEAGMWDKAAVERAIENKVAEDSKELEDKSWREDLDMPQERKAHPDFIPLVGYAYRGHVPYTTSDGFERRRVEVLSGETVMSDPQLGRLPFFEYTVGVKGGRFVGVSPLEVIRYDQDFADGLKMLTADGAAVATHPPRIIDRNQGVDVAKVLRWHPDVPIMSDSASAVQQVQYNPPIGPGMAVYSNLKQQMREGSGALGPIQGLSDGPDRESATGFAGRSRAARGRPEAQALLSEREYLPPLAQHILSLYKRFSTTADLRDRLGQLPEPANLAQITKKHDVQFVGSRVEGSRAEKLQAYRELFALAQFPIAAQLAPWDLIIVRFLRHMGLHEEAAEVGTQIEQNRMLQQQGQPGPGNGNGEALRNPPSGLAPAQEFGGVQ